MNSNTQFDSEAIPQELRDLDQWVDWRFIVRSGSKKPTKVPFSAETGKAASTTDPFTWTTFGAVLFEYKLDKYDGIGFVFSEDDPYTGIDLDGAFDPETGVMADWAQDIIDRFATYTEWSPSGTGVHLIIKGKLPGKGRREGSVEIYSKARYFTFTGARVDGTTPLIEERSGELVQFYQEIFGEADTKQSTPRPAGRPFRPKDDKTVIKKAKSAKNGASFTKLIMGDSSDYPSPSEADLALCSHLIYWTNGDTGQTDRLFRQSGLMRPKWDEKHGDQTYGEMTIAKAHSGAASSLDRPQPSGENEDAKFYPLTDSGNAEWFAELYGNDLRYDHARKRWLIWTGHRWAPDSDGQIYRLVKDAARERYFAAGNLEDLELRDKIAKFATSSESRARLDACLALSQNERPIADAGKDWDADPYLLGLQNGVLDLRAGDLRPGERDDRITMNVPVNYDPRATCPRWVQFLREVFQDDTELINFIQRAVGYSLTGSIQEQVLFLCHGTGANGKSVFLNVLRHLGGDYAMNMPFTVLELNQQASQTNDLAAMATSRLVTSSETNESTRLNEARIKALTGGDPITARFLYGEFFTYEPVATFWLAVNHLPRVRDDSHGFWRRVRVLPFTQRFSDKDADQDLTSTLLKELPGILSWAVRGALSWQRVGLAPPDTVVVATEAYREESDELADFFSERCVQVELARVEPRKLFSDYQDWAKDQGIPERSRLGSRTFSNRIGERFGKAVSSNGKREYHGVGLMSTQ